MKKCKTCGKQKQILDFPVRIVKIKLKDGTVRPYTCYATWCRDCDAIRMREYRKNSTTYRTRFNKYIQEWTKKRMKIDPFLILKEKTRRRTRELIRYGKIKRLPCSVCEETRSQAHHEDYNKPEEIVFLCRKHHNELHRSRRLYKYQIKI